MRKKRVLVLDPAGLLWGSERALLDFIGIMPGLEAACCLPPQTPLIGKLQKIGIRVFPTFLSNLHKQGYGARFLALIGLIRAMTIYRPDVLHVNQAGAARLAAIACRLLRVPCIVHVRLREDVEYLAKLNPNPKIVKALIAISDPIASLIQSRRELGGIPCHLRLDAYRPEIEEMQILTDDSQQWDLICVGRFSESKGQHLLIHAIDHLNKKGKRLTLAFVGDINDWGRQMQALMTELGIDDQVVFLGHSDAVGLLLEQARWLVCPSEYEPLGRVLFEAWDHGIPVISCVESGGAAVSVSASGGGLLFKHWTAEALANRLEIAMGLGISERNAMAAKGREWLLRETHPLRYAECMTEIFQSAIHSAS